MKATNNGFNKKWKHTENLFCEHFNCDDVQELSLQYKDIDAINKKSGETFSIKDIGDASKTYGCILLETTLLSSTRGTETKGSFYKCEADWFVIRLWYEGHFRWFVTKTDELRKLIKTKDYSTVRTRPETEANNRKQGRVYDGTICVKIPVEELISSCKKILIPIAAFKSAKCKEKINTLLEKYNMK